MGKRTPLLGSSNGEQAGVGLRRCSARLLCPPVPLSLWDLLCTKDEALKYAEGDAVEVGEEQADIISSSSIIISLCRRWTLFRKLFILGVLEVKKASSTCSGGGGGGASSSSMRVVLTTSESSVATAAVSSSMGEQEMIISFKGNNSSLSAVEKF